MSIDEAIQTAEAIRKAINIYEAAGLVIELEGKAYREGVAAVGEAIQATVQ
jgi:hypothetical protein